MLIGALFGALFASAGALLIMAWALRSSAQANRVQSQTIETMGRELRANSEQLY